MDEIAHKTQENPPGKPNHKPNGDFAPGNNANPLGRPKKGNAWADIREELLSASKIRLSLTSSDKDGNDRTRILDLSTDAEKTFRHAVLVRQIQNALSGDDDAIRDLMDREEGKPRQAVDLGGQATNPLNMKWDFVICTGEDKKCSNEIKKAE